MDFSDSSVRAKQLQPRDREFVSPHRVAAVLGAGGAQGERSRSRRKGSAEGSAFGGRFKKMSNVLELFKNKKTHQKT